MAAAASSSTPLDPHLGRAADFVRPDFHQVNLDIEGFLKTQKGYKLDADTQICPLSLTPLGCPLPPSQCPYRHTNPSPANFQPPPPLPPHPREREKKLTVCKHYLRNLCKMGDNCEYTHDWNLRTMPVCVMFVKQGKCELGGECLYFHPRDRRVECPDYKRGFCLLGPECPRKHIRKRLCGAYQSGFCPDGEKCKLSHPPADRPQSEEYINPVPPDPTQFTGPPPQLPAGYGRWREYRYDPNAVVVPAPAWVEGGSLSGWRAGGFLSSNARRNEDRDGHGHGHGGHGGRSNDNRDNREVPQNAPAGYEKKTGWVKDLSTVLCFRCNQYGHFANTCPNQAVPGDRGGLKRERD
ncbi:mRNA 3'-end-processing protein YTH1 [Kwoniella mangroviensis CBS 10435]|uniref:mRNA 3'-end-processing protein n=1 Tax=Kwoniella mangroviensis CBS 10435 TaxID=1331196 RepID=A0A1B9IIJ1_9TREE|nr:mRNA 3'-end-processing protein YTH1 [Kwoniella mangroviensis CBS 8507]OCF55194.1 mRNA 3'-end-processing protein YTH1 [Kwoniella mangroviensis CBS 10435]OCF65845.1 mRNA 3'-end-processing protein YTH1 [Kwoniella mangroviensis CBS 8507]OCF72077.1 mRNA 3'-end-processing protein YTH1 [Kwoniella mangroviensis CBS 8886]